MVHFYTTCSTHQDDLYIDKVLTFSAAAQSVAAIPSEPSPPAASEVSLPTPSPEEPLVVAADEKSQILTTNAELVLEWDDYFLQWDPANFSNIKSTRLDPSRLWFPDIILYNSASIDYRAGLVSTYLMVTYTGRVKYLVAGIFQSICNLDVSYFPFDEQICTLKFSPWTMDKSAVRMNASSPENGLKAYVAVGKFKMISLEPKKSTTEDPCCIGLSFDDVTYYMKFQRRPMYYIINYIFPSILINVIGIMIFYVPCGSGEKISLGISAMLALVVFLMAMTDALPPADTIPLLSTYYVCSLILMTSEVLCSIIVLNIYHRGEYGLRATDTIIGIAFVMAKEKKDSLGETYISLAAKQAEEDFWKSNLDLLSTYKSSTKDKIFSKRFGITGHPSYKEYRPRLASDQVGFEFAANQLLERADKALAMMEVSQQQHKDADYKNVLTLEYLELARIYDRFFLVLYSILTVTASFGTLLSSPYASSVGI
ncbi:unnamed protein product [Notodromas monacha]|uniref:Uncharacterized protein n=1 Tax=Notodromas monacha TaxID=399045 RepID=A0A7R9BDU0_9CRUS|nr:unnamed protein product [Notodromas monacha]CAG0912406.1 unnamed protein product [Notodromas monacha]